MNTVLIFLLAASFFVVALVSGGIATLFKAKRPSMLLAFLVVVLTAGTAIGIHQYVDNNSIIVLSAALAVYVVSLSLLLGMKMLDTLIAALAGITIMGMMLFAGGMALEKYQKSPVLDTMLSYVKDNQSFISFSTLLPNNKLASTNRDTPVQDDEFVIYTEDALLSEGAGQKLKVLDSKIFHTVKVTDAYTLKGSTVRILKKNGDTLQGTITTTRGNSLMLGIYLPDSKGMITAPVPLSVISKLEVYR